MGEGFHALSKLDLYMPCTKNSISRVAVFQNHCKIGAINVFTTYKISRFFDLVQNGLAFPYRMCGHVFIGRVKAPALIGLKKKSLCLKLLCPFFAHEPCHVMTNHNLLVSFYCQHELIKTFIIITSTFISSAIAILEELRWHLPIAAYIVTILDV